MTDQVKIVDTVTGAILDDLPYSTFSLTATVDWTRHDTFTVTVPLTGVDARREQVTGIAYEPWKRTLLLIRDGAPLWAGPLMTTQWGHTSVSFGCGGLTQLLDLRMVAFTVAETYSLSLDQRDTITALLTRATSRGGAFALPLSIGSALGGDPATERSWPGYDFATVYESVKKIVEEDGAPDVRVDATVSGSTLGWVIRYGAPYLGAVTPTAAWDFPSTVQTLTGDFDGTSMLTHGWALGDGQGAERVALDAVNDLTSRGWPAMERADRTAVSTKDVTVVQARADALAAEGARQAAKRTVNVDPAYPALRGWTLGDNVKLRTAGHWFLPDGEEVVRATGFTLTESSLALEVAEPLTWGGIAP